LQVSGEGEAQDQEEESQDGVGEPHETKVAPGVGENQAGEAPGARIGDEGKKGRGRESYRLSEWSGLSWLSGRGSSSLEPSAWLVRFPGSLAPGWVAVWISFSFWIATLV